MRVVCLLNWAIFMQSVCVALSTIAIEFCLFLFGFVTLFSLFRHSKMNFSFIKGVKICCCVLFFCVCLCYIFLWNLNDGNFFRSMEATHLKVIWCFLLLSLFILPNTHSSVSVCICKSFVWIKYPSISKKLLKIYRQYCFFFFSLLSFWTTTKFQYVRTRLIDFYVYSFSSFVHFRFVCIR